MIAQKLTELGYKWEMMELQRNFKGVDFQAATRVGNLVFTSGQVSVLDGKEMRGKVGLDIDLEMAQKGAEWAAYNCLRAAGAVVDIEKIKRVVKLLGIVNVAEGFDQTSEVINVASNFLNKIFEDSGHARTAVGMVLPSNWAVEIEMVVEVE